MLAAWSLPLLCSAAFTSHNMRRNEAGSPTSLAQLKDGESSNAIPGTESRRRMVAPVPPAPDMSEQLDSLQQKIESAQEMHATRAEVTKASADEELAKVQQLSDKALAVADDVAAETTQLYESEANANNAIDTAQRTSQKVVDEEKITSEKQDVDRRMVQQAATDTTQSLAGNAFNINQNFKTQADKMNVGTEMAVKEAKYKTDVAVEKTRLDVSEANKVMDERMSAFATQTDAMLDKEADTVDELPDSVDAVKKLQDDGQDQIVDMQKGTRDAIAKIDTAPIKMKDIEDKVSDAMKELEEKSEDGADEVAEALDAGLEETTALTKQINDDVTTKASELDKKVRNAAQLRLTITTNQQSQADALKGEISDLQAGVSENAKKLTMLSKDFEDKRSDAKSELSAHLVTKQKDGQDQDKRIGEELATQISASATSSLNVNADEASNLQSDNDAKVDEVRSAVQATSSVLQSSMAETKSAVEGARSATDTLMADVASGAAQLSGMQTQAEVIMKKATQASETAIQQVGVATDNSNQRMGTMVDMAAQKMAGINEDQRSRTVSVVPEMEEPVKAKASEFDRETNGAITDTQLHVEGLLHGVDAEYEKIYHAMTAAGVTPDGNGEEDEVLKLIDNLVKDMKSQQAKKDQYEQDKEKESKDVLTLTKIAASTMEEGGREQQQALIQSEKSNIHAFEDKTFQGPKEGISAQTLTLVQEKARIAADRKDAEDKHEYSKEREEDWEATIEKEQTRATEENARLEAAAHRIGEEGLQELQATATTAAENAQTTVDMAVSQIQTDEKTLLYQTKEQLLANAGILKQNNLAGIELTREELLKLFDAQRVAEAAKLATIEQGAESVTFDADKATQQVKQVLDANVDEATHLSQDAAMETANTLAVTNSMNQQTTAEGNRIEESVTRGEEYADERSAADIEEQQAALMQEVNGMAANNAGNEASGENMVQEVENLVNEAGETVNAAKDSSETAAEEAGKLAEGAAEQAEADAAQENANLEADNEEFNQKLKAESTDFENGEERQDQVMHAIDGEAGGITEENKLKIDALSEEAAAEQKKIGAEINTKFDSAEMLAANAEQALEQSKYSLDTEKNALNAKMAEVQDELRKKANLTSQEIDAFRTLTDTEHKNLDSNVQYLRNYDLMTQSQVLQLLEGVEKTVSGAAAHSQSRYDEVEEQEKALSSNMGNLMEGEAFKTLKTIMSADDFVQKAAVENSELVHYMNEFKKDQLSYMDALMKTLTDAQYALLLHDNEVKNEQEAIDADAGALTGSVIGSIQSLVGNETAGGEGAALEGMTADTLKMLLSKAQTGSAQDKEQIALIMQKIKQQGAGGMAHLDNAQHLIDQINAATSGNGAFESMRADLQRVVEFSEKMNEAERKRMEERGLKLSDQLFYGDQSLDSIRTPRGYGEVPAWKKNEYKQQAKQMVQDAYGANQTALMELHEQHKNDPKVKAALDRTKLLSSLLQKNAQLMSTNKALNAKHEELGHRVEEEAAMRQHHEA